MKRKIEDYVAYIKWLVLRVKLYFMPFKQGEQVKHKSNLNSPTMKVIGYVDSLAEYPLDISPNNDRDFVLCEYKLTTGEDKISIYVPEVLTRFQETDDVIKVFNLFGYKIRISK